MQVLAAGLTGTDVTVPFECFNPPHRSLGDRKFVFSGVVDGSYQLEQWNSGGEQWEAGEDYHGDPVAAITSNGEHNLRLATGTTFRFSVTSETGPAKIVIVDPYVLVLASV